MARQWNNKGMEIEGVVRRIFKGRECPEYCIDFVTKRHAYEVKSCKMFKEVASGKCAPGKKSVSLQLGRFRITNENHVSLRDRAIMMKVVPMYIFVISLGKQVIIKKLPWNEVDAWINKDKDVTDVSIRQVWKEETK